MSPRAKKEAAPPEPIAGGDEFIVDQATDEVMRLHLDHFEGPLEVLLYLIKSQEIDIFDIPIVTITEQYLRFLDLMEVESLEVTGDFLVMAATLIQIKSRMLLPADTDLEQDENLDEEDPRLELVEKLLEYRRYREVSERLQRLETERAEWYARNVKPAIERADEQEEEMLEVNLYDLVQAFRGYLRFFIEEAMHTVAGEVASVDQKIELIETKIAADGSVSWTELLRECRSRVELICCFLAILELCRMGRMRAHQHHIFEDIRLFPVAEAEPEAAPA